MIPNKHHGKKARNYQIKEKNRIYFVNNPIRDLYHQEIIREAWERCFPGKSFSQVAAEIAKKYP
jgi:hypothetical protein